VPQSCYNLHKIAKVMLAKHLEGKQCKPITEEHTHIPRTERSVYEYIPSRSDYLSRN